MRTRGQQGFTLIELMVSMTVMLFILAGLAQMALESSRINRAQQMTVQAQANARNCMSMVVQRLRSAGWDPMNTGLQTVAWDAVPGDGISEIEIFTDLDGDGATNGTDEQMLIQHTNGRIQWRRSNDVSEPFTILASNISNDADGDGTVEDMFVEISNPPLADRVLVQITAQSPAPDPITGEFIRYTVQSEVALRKTL
jgi:prepilin-type N-terminal cleavage/methylation domain-containing protein